MTVKLALHCACSYSLVIDLSEDDARCVTEFFMLKHPDGEGPHRRLDRPADDPLEKLIEVFERGVTK